MNYIETFKIKTCNKITLQYFNKMSDARDGKAPIEKEIIDENKLKQILFLLNKLPDEGDMMVKMGDVPILNVILQVDKNEPVYFTYYQSAIKTPATSFYSIAPTEVKLLHDLFLDFF